MKRLFVGLALPAACKRTLFELDPHLPGLRWVPEEQLHLTLSFLGAEFGLMKVTGFELYSSVLTAAGANHGLEMRKEF